MAQKKHHSQSGFALAWAAVLTIVAGMAAVTFVNAIQGAQTWDTVADTQDNIDDLIAILTAYQREQHSLPCPASLTEPMSSANFGVARNAIPVAGICDNSGTADGAHTAVVNVSGQRVRIGAVPTRTLGLSDSVPQDKWGNRLLYAVTEELTDPFTYTSADGAITIIDDSGTLATDIGYIVVSQGSDQNGAYRHVTGTVVRTCLASIGDVENCDNDAVFKLEDYSFE